MMTVDIDSAAFMQTQVAELVAQSPTGRLSPGVVRVAATLWAGGTVEQDGGAFEGSEMGQGRISYPARGAISLLGSSGWLARNGIIGPNPHSVAIIEKAPKHGRLEPLANGAFRYTPNKGFLGKDFVSFIIDIEGKKVRLNVPLFVVKVIEEPKAESKFSEHQNLTAQVVMQSSFDLS